MRSRRAAIAVLVLLAAGSVALQAERDRRYAQAVDDARLLIPIFLIYLQLLIVTAIALFFSTFASPLLAAAFTLGLWVAGHFSADLRALDEVVEAPVASALGTVLYYVLPNLSAFDVKSLVVHGQPVAAGLVAMNTLYAAAVIGVLLIAAGLIFARRDFK